MVSINIAKVKITNNVAQVVDPQPITSGMNGATVAFVFDSTWDGYNKTLVWKAGDVTKDDTTASGVIPGEVLAVPGVVLKVGVYGVRDGVVTPTVYAKLGQILPGADPSGDESTDPTLPVWVQVQEDIERLEAASDQAVEAAEQSTDAARESQQAAQQSAAAASESERKAVEAVEAALGDIDAALDSILAMQNALIGGGTE